MGMDKTLGYLREILSNYSDQHSEGRQLFKKLSEGSYLNEGMFVRDLSAKEADFLNHILPKEINYAREEQDEKRAYQLNEVYELLL
jgi:Minor curli fiber component A